MAFLSFFTTTKPEHQRGVVSTCGSAPDLGEPLLTITGSRTVGVRERLKPCNNKHRPFLSKRTNANPWRWPGGSFDPCDLRNWRGLARGIFILRKINTVQEPLRSPGKRSVYVFKFV